MDGKIIHHKGAESRLHFRAPYKVAWQVRPHVGVFREKICEIEERKELDIQAIVSLSGVPSSPEFISPTTLGDLTIMMMKGMPERRLPLTN